MRTDCAATGRTPAAAATAPHAASRRRVRRGAVIPEFVSMAGERRGYARGTEPAGGMLRPDHGLVNVRRAGAFASVSTGAVGAPLTDESSSPGLRVGLLKPRERPSGVLADERLVVVERAREHLDVVGRADVPEHDGRVALQPAQLRALHRTAPERRAELRLRHLQDVARERPRILAREHLARRELRSLEFLRESGIPRADGLGHVAPVQPPARTSWPRSSE